MAAKLTPRPWIVAVILLSGVACGAPEGPTTSSPQQESAGDLATFCDAARDLDEAALSEKGHPDDSQLDRFVDAAPPDIKDEAEILAASAREFRSGNDEAASSGEIQEAADRFDDYMKENCKNV